MWVISLRLHSWLSEIAEILSPGVLTLLFDSFLSLN